MGPTATAGGTGTQGSHRASVISITTLFVPHHIRMWRVQGLWVLDIPSSSLCCIAMARTQLSDDDLRSLTDSTRWVSLLLVGVSGLVVLANLSSLSWRSPSESTTLPISSPWSRNVSGNVDETLKVVRGGDR